MARQNGSLSTANGSRRRITQPVLPALPLTPKTKINDSRTNKGENEVTNGVGNELSAASEPVANVQPRKSLDAQDSKEDDGLSLQKSRSTETDGTISLDQEKPLDQDFTQGNGEIQTETHDGEKLAGRNHHQNPEAVKITEEPTTSTDDSVNTHQDNIQDSVIDITNGHVESDSFVVNKAAPDDPGYHTPLASASHSAHPSISNSSIQQTPKHDTGTPVSSDSSQAVPQPAIMNGNQQSTTNTLINGNVSATSFSGTVTDTLTSPPNHHGFPTLLDHIRSLAFSPDWYDSELCVYFQSPKPVIYRNAHSLVLIRSERLRTFIYPQKASSYSYFIINICPVRPINSNAFDAALRFLYADTILSAERLLPANTYMGRSAKVNALDYVVSYMVAGLELGIEPVVTRGLDLIGRLLDWDIAELTAREAAVLQSAPPPAMNPHSPPDTQLAAKLIYQHIFNLIVLRLDVQNFKLDTITSPVDMPSRFAQLEPSKSVNPALANMVFGSMPTTAELSPASSQEVPPQVDSSPDSIASNIMLNLEFEELCGLSISLERAHKNHGMRVINEVVEERERRRLHIFTSRTTSAKQRMADSAAWDVIGWREYVDGNNVLRREQVGFLVPSKRNNNTN